MRSTATRGKWLLLDITELEHSLHHRTFSWAVLFSQGFLWLQYWKPTAAGQGWQQEEQRGGYGWQMVAARIRASSGGGESDLTAERGRGLAMSLCWQPGCGAQKSSTMHQPDFINHHLITLRNGGHWVVAEWYSCLGCSTQNRENFSSNISLPPLKINGSVTLLQRRAMWELEKKFKRPLSSHIVYESLTLKNWAINLL